MTAELQGEFVNICPGCPSRGLLDGYSVCIVEIVDELQTIDREGVEQIGLLLDVSHRVLQGVPEDVEPRLVADLDQQYSAALQAHVSTQSYVTQKLLEIDLLKTVLGGIECAPEQACPKLAEVQDYTRMQQ
jgi:hypothetical protein